LEPSFEFPEIEDGPEMKISRQDIKTNFICCDACAGCGDKCGDPKCLRCANKPSKQPISDSGFFGRLTGSGSRLQAYSICQVKRCCQNGQHLITAHGKVYDATKFLNCHPAGPRAILKKVGQDCTIDFDFHSAKARKEIWGPLEVGRLVTCAVHGPAQTQTSCLVMWLLKSCNFPMLPPLISVNKWCEAVCFFMHLLWRDHRFQLTVFAHLVPTERFLLQDSDESMVT
jgi:hypothetical protein